MSEEDGDVGGEGEQPGESYQPPHIPHSPGGQGGDRVDHGQVPDDTKHQRRWGQLNRSHLSAAMRTRV